MMVSTIRLLQHGNTLATAARKAEEQAIVDFANSARLSLAAAFGAIDMQVPDADIGVSPISDRRADVFVFFDSHELKRNGLDALPAIETRMSRSFIRWEAWKVLDGIMLICRHACHCCGGVADLGSIDSREHLATQASTALQSIAAWDGNCKQCHSGCRI